MKKYVIRYNSAFLRDLSDSFEWGVSFWGRDAAEKWYNEIEELIQKRLSTMPERYPLAPESDYIEGVRQLIMGRYRILFLVRNKDVFVLHLRGPYANSLE